MMPQDQDTGGTAPPQSPPSPPAADPEAETETKPNRSCETDTGREDGTVPMSSFERDDVDVSLRFGKSESSATAVSARKDWANATKLVKKKVVLAKTAVAKVNLENKIGTRAEELEGDGFLKVLGLGAQRALRDFGAARAAEERGVDINQSGASISAEAYAAGEKEVEIGIGLEGMLRTPNIIDFEAEAEGLRYAVRQPAFQCRRVCNHTFTKIRSAFGISERQYHAVFGLQEGLKESNLYVIGSNDASGKSSSFFFLSPDQRYILKSCTSKDVRTLVDIVKRYQKYIESQRRFCKEKGTSKTLPSPTLLPRYLGLYSLQFADPEVPRVVMVAMTNFFGGAHRIHVKYDLKGSTHNRLASEKERSKKSPVYKDLDWMEEGRKLRFPSRTEMERVRDQLQRDTAFLCAEGLIDYSLLVGLHEMDVSEEQAWRYGKKSEAVRVIKAKSDKDRTIAYYGIVDVLTPYGLRKRGETLLTGTVLCCRDVSCQPPEMYQRRFMEFCNGEVFAFDNEGNENKEEDGDGKDQCGLKAQP